MTWNHRILTCVSAVTSFDNGFTWSSHRLMAYALWELRTALEKFLEYIIQSVMIDCYPSVYFIRPPSIFKLCWVQKFTGCCLTCRCSCHKLILLSGILHFSHGQVCCLTYTINTYRTDSCNQLLCTLIFAEKLLTFNLLTAYWFVLINISVACLWLSMDYKFANVTWYQQYAKYCNCQFFNSTSAFSSCQFVVTLQNGVCKYFGIYVVPFKPLRWASLSICTLSTLSYTFLSLLMCNCQSHTLLWSYSALQCCGVILDSIVKFC